MENVQMSTHKSTKVQKVFLRLREHYNLPSDKALSVFLGVDYDKLMQWKKRDRIPRLDVFLVKCTGISTKFLETGEGEMFPLASQEPQYMPRVSDGGVKEDGASWQAKPDPLEIAFLADWKSLSDVGKMRIWTLLKEEKEREKAG
jgi:hypothetical protein